MIGIIEELIRVEHKLMILFTKVLPRLEHYISTSFGISSGYYGGYNNTTDGTDQGIKLSWNGCRDTSCFIIKKPE